jgi:protein-S-isoprenylcysteine O-methyltransferase Ste14
MKKLRRIPLFLGALLLVLFARPNYPGTLVGVILILGGEVLRIWAAGHLRKNENLTVTGPYAYLKNPLYVGSILITTGFCILADNIYILAAATLAFCFHYIPYKRRVEGDRLKRIFGDLYEDYDQKVPDYVPRWTPYSEARASWSLTCFFENSEAGIVLLNVLGIFLIISRPYWGSAF